MDRRTDRDRARAKLLAATQCPGGTVDLRQLRGFVPEEWAARASVGLDGVLRVTLPPTDTDSAVLALPPDVREDLATVAGAMSPQPNGEDAVEALGASHRLTTMLAGVRLRTAHELTARTAEKALRLKGVSSPEELSATARERWRARSKSVTATELSVLTGMGRGAAREVVAIANAPRASAVAVRQALDTGIAGWDLVTAWWRRCSRMSHEAGATVARALFGTDIPAEEAAVERLTPEGELSTAPWAKKQFFEALERHARALEATDPAAEQRKREARHASRDAYGIVDDDGTAQLVVSGDAASVTAALERLQTLARRARDAGDQRTMAQLRSDLARALLLHGTLPLPDLGSDPNFVTPDDIERLVDVLAGAPAHEVQVIVPWDVLSGHAAVVNHAPARGACAHEGAPATSPPRTATPAESPPAGAAPAGSPAEGGTPAGSPPTGATPAGSPAADATPAEGGTTRAFYGAPSCATRPGPVEGVGRVLGRFSRFLTGAEVRRLAGRPGTTLYRLLTDPADGRCLERSVTRYAPDGAMRAQLRAADVLSRAPGSTVPAHACDLDHVEEYLLGGPTSETNLQSVERAWHALKTEKFWDAAIDGTRNVTWESFWGRIYRTRPHDYRQYLTRPWSDQAGLAPETSQPTPADLTPDEQRHLASLLVYAALAHRSPAEHLEAPDDDPDSDAEILGVREATWLRRTTGSGRRTTGPRPGTPTPEQLLGHDPQTVLDHPDWTNLGASAHASQDACDDHADTAEPGAPGEADPPAADQPPPPF